MLFITKLCQIWVLLQQVLHVRKPACVVNEAFLCFEGEHSTSVHLMATGGTYQYSGIWSNLVRSLRLRSGLLGLRTWFSVF